MLKYRSEDAMRARPFEHRKRAITRCLTQTFYLASALAFTATPAMAAPGDTILNGTSTGITIPGFLFEPEVPLASLKTVPIWNEIEQLLDNPYAVTPDTATPGNDQGFPSYRATGVTRRPSFGVTLPALLVDPLNYNPTTGEEMRLINPNYPGGSFRVPDQLVQCTVASTPPGCPAIPDPNRYVWSYKTVQVSPGAGRVPLGDAAISYNAPFAPDVGLAPFTPSLFTCITTTEAVPPEGSILCGGDPGEPGYLGFGVLNATLNYSTPAVPGVTAVGTPIPATARLFDPARGVIQARNPGTGVGGLRKPSLRVPPIGTPNQPGYLVNSVANLATNGADTLTPSNENDYVRNRAVAIALGKSLFWDMQVGSDGVQSCGTCHFTGPGTDTRTKNQLNPNHLGGDLVINLHNPTADPTAGANQQLTLADFPLHKVNNPDVAGDPLCTTPITASVNAAVLENNFPGGVSGFTVCDALNIASDVNDVASSMGVVFNKFIDIAPIGAFQPVANGVQAVMPDVRTTGNPTVDTANAVALDPIPAFQGFRRVEPCNTPTMQAAGFNLDNFWDGRARHDFNGGSVFGAADPQSHVFVDDPSSLTLVPTRQIIRFTSIASLATGPGLSEFEMSFQGRNWSKVGKKLLQAGVTPLANQLVDTTDGVLGPYSNQGGSACAGLASWDRSPGTPAAGKPGLCISYPGLIRQAFYPALWQNVTGMHLNGCYTDGNAAIHPNQCAAGVVSIPVLDTGAVVNSAADPFDGYVLTPAAGAAVAADTNQFRQMEGNFSLFWGLGVNLWVGILVPDNTPLDQFLDRNPGAFAALGEPGEIGLVPDQLNCGSTGADPNYCFREFGNFKRDTNVVAFVGATGEGGVGGTPVAAGGTRVPGSNTPDPLLGFDIFFSSNLSLKNPNFRTARCGECHAIPTLTDHTVAFTTKSQLRDFVAEFIPGLPGVENVVEPLGRLRVISGFLLESELNENGQDAVERRIRNQSLVPCPADGLAYPGGSEPGTGQGFGPCSGSAAGFFDNGVYNLGVRPIGEDIGRGGNDAFGWPLSLATLILKNLGGVDFEPGVPLPTFDPTTGGVTGGLFEESAQDQQINPGFEADPVNPKLPPYLAPFANQIPVGDSMPELDEAGGPAGGMVNTLTDIAMLEGFVDTLGPFNPAGILNESYNAGEGQLMGEWPNVNRVGRMGSFKAPQLRDVELTGPYFHNGGKLTLRQVVDFYVRGGDFPLTNAAHRDFNMVNMDIEVQSNLTEAEKVALVDFLLELTDERAAHDAAPFDHPQVIIPVDGLAPDNTLGRAALLANPLFRNVPAVGAAGFATREPTFLNVTKVRLSNAAANRGSAQCNYVTGPVSHYCH